MKALKLALAISLALNVGLGWLVWRAAPPAATAPSPLPATAMTLSEPAPAPSMDLPDAEDLLPLTPDRMKVLPLVAPVDRSWGLVPLSPAPAAVTPTHPTPPPNASRPYADPLPPNPHAVPLWERRVPYRNGQLERGLYPNLKFEVPPTRD